MMHPDTATLALKEWAVAVKALAEGAQVLAAEEGRHPPRGQGLPNRAPAVPLVPHLRAPEGGAAQARIPWRPAGHSARARRRPPQVTISYWTEVTAKFELRDESALDRLSPFHIWTGSYARKRLHWRPKQPLTVALLRVYRLQEPQAIPLLDEYEGCKSWVDLGCEVPLGNMVPVLDDSQYEAKAASIGEVIGA